VEKVPIENENALLGFAPVDVGLALEAILGTEREVIKQGIGIRYRDIGEASFNARNDLDKIIQVPFNLPKLCADQISAYLGGRAACRSEMSCGFGYSG